MTDPRDSQDQNEQEPQQSGPPPIPGKGYSDQHQQPSGPSAPPDEQQGGYTYAQPTSQPSYPPSYPDPNSPPVSENPPPPPPPESYGQQSYPQQPTQDYGQQQQYGQQQGGSGQQGYGQQPTNYPYGNQPQGYDNYHYSGTSYVAGNQTDALSITGIVISIFGMLLAICCWPISLGLGVGSTIIGYIKKQEAKAQNTKNTSAEFAFWLGIATIVISILVLLLNVIITILNPDLAQQMMQDLGL